MQNILKRLTSYASKILNKIVQSKIEKRTKEIWEDQFRFRRNRGSHSSLTSSNREKIMEKERLYKICEFRRSFRQRKMEKNVQNT